MVIASAGAIPPVVFCRPKCVSRPVDANAQRWHGGIRTHWESEIGVHWVLEVAMGENTNRMWKGAETSERPQLPEKFAHRLASLRLKLMLHGEAGRGWRTTR